MEEARNNQTSETHVEETNNEDLQNSYFRIRALVRQLRPHFMQVIIYIDFTFSPLFFSFFGGG